MAMEMKETLDQKLLTGILLSIFFHVKFGSTETEVLLHRKGSDRTAEK